MPRKKTAEADDAPPKDTGLFILCPASHWDVGQHKVLVEVTRCRNGSHRIHCKVCGFTGFMVDARWRKTAMTLDAARASVGWDFLVPARGGIVTS